MRLVPENQHKPQRWNQENYKWCISSVPYATLPLLHWRYRPTSKGVQPNARRNLWKEENSRPSMQVKNWGGVCDMMIHPFLECPWTATASAQRADTAVYHTHRPVSQDRSKKYSLGKCLSTWADQTIFANVLYTVINKDYLNSKVVLFCFIVRLLGMNSTKVIQVPTILVWHN